MGLSGFLFISWRLFEMITLIPIVGMLAWFVHGYVDSNQLTPTSILLLFIVSVLALAWVFFTLIGYLRARHDAFFVAAVDLAFVASLIAAVVVLRGIGSANCSNFDNSNIYRNLGVFGQYGQASGSRWADNLNKNCSMLKASWAFAIINIIAFMVTFVRFYPFTAQQRILLTLIINSSSLSSSTVTTATTTKFESSARLAKSTIPGTDTVVQQAEITEAVATNTDLAVAEGAISALAADGSTMYD